MRWDEDLPSKHWHAGQCLKPGYFPKKHLCDKKQLYVPFFSNLGGLFWISCEKTGSLPCPWDPFSVEKTGHLTSGGFLKWCYPQNTPKWSFLVGKPMVVGYHHFRKHPSRQVDNVVRCCPSLRWFMGFCDLLSFTHVNTCDKQVTVVPTVVAFNEKSLDDLEVVDICFPTKTTPSTFNKSTHIEKHIFEAFKVSGLWKSGYFSVSRYLFLEPNPGDPLNHEAAEVPYMGWWVSTGLGMISHSQGYRDSNMVILKKGESSIKKAVFPWECHKGFLEIHSAQVWWQKRSPFFTVPRKNRLGFWRSCGTTEVSLVALWPGFGAGILVRFQCCTVSVTYSCSCLMHLRSLRGGAVAGHVFPKPLA